MQSQEPLQHPLFIVGAVRSGTTLFILMLDRHPCIYNFGEFEFAVNRARGDDFPDLDAYLAMIEQDRQFQDSGLEIRTRTDYRSLVQDFLLQFHERDRSPVISASVHSRFDLLPQLFPGARFIHIVRDPRDVARSYISMGWVGNVHEGVHYWLEAEQRWERLRSRLAEGTYLDIRSEELVSAPEQTLTRVSTFIGVDFDPRMQSLDEHPTYSSPDPTLNYQWRRKLSPAEILQVEYQCRELMRARGYEPVTPEGSHPGRLRILYLKLQSRLCRMAGNFRRYGLLGHLAFLFSRSSGPVSLNRQLVRARNDIDRAGLK